jgi:hypothetical protein
MLIFFLVSFHYLDGYQASVEDFAVMCGQSFANDGGRLSAHLARKFKNGSFTSWSGDSLSALGNLMCPTDASDLHGRQPAFPHRRVDRRSIGPFQTTYEKLNLLVGLAPAPPSGFEEYPHRVIAFNYRDRVDLVHDVHVR